MFFPETNQLQLDCWQKTLQATEDLLNPFLGFTMIQKNYKQIICSVEEPWML
jgi:hypothetical protein